MATNGETKGRARGRSRGPPPTSTARPPDTIAAPPTAVPTPPAAAQEPPTVGKTRGRGGTSVGPPTTGPSPTSSGSGGTPLSGIANMNIAGTGQGSGAGSGSGTGTGTGTGSTRGPSPRLVREDIRTRPEGLDKRGTSGTVVKVCSNFFELTQKKDFGIFQYAVSYNPEIDNKRFRSKLLYDHSDKIGNVRIFDGMTLYLPIMLSETESHYVSKRTSDNEDIHVTIKYTNKLHRDSPASLQLYNTLFRKLLEKIGMEQIGRYYYHYKRPQRIEKHKIEIWPGFITSILNYESRVMLCADVSHKLLRTDSVLDYLYQLYEETRGDFHEVATKKLVGEIVLTRYNNKTYRIDDIDWTKNPTHTFDTKEGPITYLEYYQKAYNRKLEDVQQPLLVSRPKKRDQRRGQEGPIYLVPEVCTRTGLSEETREDFHVMRDIAEHTRIKPDQRGRQLKSFMDELSNKPECQDIMNSWGIQFSSNILSFDARVAPPEKIFQKNSSYSYRPGDAEWSREMKGNELINTVPLTKYLLLFSRRDSAKAQDFFNNLAKVGPPMGMPIADPIVCELADDRTDTFLRAIKDNLDKKIQMVICLLPNNRKDRYDAIKKFCCVEYPVPSQVILGRTLNKKHTLFSVCTKVAMQLNCKMGGELWAVEIPLKRLMILGIDCYHDTAQKGRSVAAFISTTNETLTRFHSRVAFQHTGQELLDAIKLCMTSALRNYFNINQYLPDRIILYRDGVGDGQLGIVKDHEIPQFLECFETFDNYNPKFAVVVVKKRINTRVFLDEGGLTNPPPGTIIDTEVTKPEWYDFFLVAQSVRQGTVTPTHYNVLHDTSGLRPDHLQRLTYKLCHLYYNWQGTVRVPSPCQYAHKLAFLVGQSIHKEPSLELSNRLFFL